MISKYFNSLTIHFYSALLLSILAILISNVSVLVTYFIVLFILLPLYYTYYRRVSHMTTEEIVEKFGFENNKFLDCTDE